METIITNANRSERDREAKRLTDLTGRAVDFRFAECDCDENPFCSKCSGRGGYHEAFYLSCDHAVIDGLDVECVESGCAEREARRVESEAAKMIAKYDSHCYLCDSPVFAGQEIVRSNAERRHRSYVHAQCNPAAGVHTRASFRVEVKRADPNNWIPVGTFRQYVREAVAQSVAQQWRDLGCAEVVVTPLREAKPAAA